MAAALRLFALGRQSLWIDEVFSWYSADVGGPLRLSHLLEDVHGPLYSLLLHLWTGLAGDGEWALRLPSALFGIATVPALAWASSSWLGRDTAVPAAWLAAGSPFLVWYSQEARNYSLLMLCACLSGATLLSLRDRPGAARGLRYFAFAGAGILSNLSFALIAPLHLRWLIGGPVGRGRRVAMLAAVAVALVLLTLPWAPQIVRTWDWHRLDPGRLAPGETAPLRGSTTFHAAALPFALHAFAVGYTLGPALRELRGVAASHALARHGPELAAVVLVFGLLGWLGLRAVARRRRLADTLIWLGVPVVAVSYFALRNFKVFHPRYLAVAAPAFLMVLAAGLADLKPRARAGFAIAVAALWAFSLGQHYFGHGYAREDYRGALATVRAHAAADEQVVAVGADDPVFYYYRGPLRVLRLWLGFAADSAKLDGRIDQTLALARGSWVVLSRPEDLDPSDRFALRLDQRFTDAERFGFDGVRVWHVRTGRGERPRVGSGSDASSAR